NSSLVVMVPVRDEKLFLKVVEKVAGVAPTEEGGAHRFKVPGGPGPLSVRFRDRHAYLTLAPVEVPKDRLLPPAQVIRPLAPQTLASVRLTFEQVPAKLREQVRAGLAQFRKAITGAAPEAAGPDAGTAMVPGLTVLNMMGPLAFWADSALTD